MTKYYDHRVVFTDGAQLKELITFARANGCERELAYAIFRLLEIGTMYMVKPFSGKDTKSPDLELEPAEFNSVCIIGKDWASKSMSWAIMKSEKPLPSCLDGTGDIHGLYNGGFIYSGPTQSLDGSEPALTVSLETTGHKHQWSIHT